MLACTREPRIPLAIPIGSSALLRGRHSKLRGEVSLPALNRLTAEARTLNDGYSLTGTEHQRDASGTPTSPLPTLFRIKDSVDRRNIGDANTSPHRSEVVASHDVLIGNRHVRPPPHGSEHDAQSSDRQADDVIDNEGGGEHHQEQGTKAVEEVARTAMRLHHRSHRITSRRCALVRCVWRVAHNSDDRTQQPLVTLGPGGGRTASSRSDRQLGASDYLEEWRSFAARCRSDCGCDLSDEYSRSASSTGPAARPFESQSSALDAQ